MKCKEFGREIEDGEEYCYFCEEIKDYNDSKRHPEKYAGSRNVYLFTKIGGIAKAKVDTTFFR